MSVQTVGLGKRHVEWMKVVQVYAHVVKFVLEPDTEWEANCMADVIYTFLQQQQGYQGASFLADYDNSEYKWISYWATEEDFLLAHKNVFPILLEMIGYNCQWEPSVQVFEVYEPRLISKS